MLDVVLLKQKVFAVEKEVQVATERYRVQDHIAARLQKVLG